MRSTEERLAAVKERALEIEAKRSKRRSRLIGASAVAVSLLVILGLSFLISSLEVGSSKTLYTGTGVTASIFDVSNRLGYVLIGVLSFALGVAITILFYRIHIRNKRDQGGNHGRAA
ncbi:MAG: DUF4179 domain-containing protein [Clostridiaceae bacterium]|jgi:hypothetical protein|nr:DUF4179 domain-containing protein [Clostridiaceae bacterium]